MEGYGDTASYDQTVISVAKILQCADDVEKIVFNDDEYVRRNVSAEVFESLRGGTKNTCSSENSSLGETIFCGECGAKMRKNERFCSQCGSKNIYFSE